MERIVKDTLTLTEKDVAEEGSLWLTFERLKDMKMGKGTKNGKDNKTNQMKNVKFPKNVVLPFGPKLYETAWNSGSPEERLAEAIARLLVKNGLTDFPLKLDWKLPEGKKAAVYVKDIEDAINKELKSINVQNRVDVSADGTVTFNVAGVIKPKMPEFETITAKTVTSCDNKGKLQYTFVYILKWTEEWTKWFANPNTDFGEFIEALAEHPEIDCVDFSCMPEDSAGHKKYLTEDAVKQLLKTYDVLFICRYMPNDVTGSLGDWITWGKSCNLSFIKYNDGKVATAQYVGDEKNKIKKNDGGWLRVKSGDKYVVSKTENGKKRLLWNKATMRSVYEASRKGVSHCNRRELLQVLSGRFSKEKNVSEMYQYKNLPTKENKGEPLVAYEPIEVIDFTIGNPKDCTTVEGNKFWMESFHGSIKSFLESVISVDDNIRDNWVKDRLDKELKDDAKQPVNKRSLKDAKLVEVQEQLSLMERLGNENLKNLIKKWNEDKKNRDRTPGRKIIYEQEHREKDEDDKYPVRIVSTNLVVKKRQLAENMHFMAQWPLITERPSKDVMKPDDLRLLTQWSESDKEELLLALGLGRRWITDLSLEELLQRADAWKKETREAFVNQWNKPKKHKDQQINNSSFTQQLATIRAWEEKKKNTIITRLKGVELFETLERCSQGNDKKTFIEEWNREHPSCPLVENLKSVEQAFAISKWEKEVKENDKNEKKETDLRPHIRSRLNYIEFLNCMKQWGGAKDEVFIKRWNKEHAEHQIDPALTPVQQYLQMFVGKWTKDLRSEFFRRLRCRDTLIRLDRIAEERKNANVRNNTEMSNRIPSVSMFAFGEYIGNNLKEKAAKAGWIVRPCKKKGELYQKYGKEVVEIKYDLHPQFAWEEEERKNVFEDKKEGEDQAFTVASNAFEVPVRYHASVKNIKEGAESWDKVVDRKKVWENVVSFKDKDGVDWLDKAKEKIWNEADANNDRSYKHLSEKDGLKNMKEDSLLLRCYYTFPFGKFMESLKKAKPNLVKLDLTRFKDKGAKVALDELLQHPMWTFRLPVDRLPEFEKGKKLGLVKIQETDETAVKFIVWPRLLKVVRMLKVEKDKDGKMPKITKDRDGRCRYTLDGKNEFVKKFANQNFEEFKEVLKTQVRFLKPHIVVIRGDAKDNRSEWFWNLFKDESKLISYGKQELLDFLACEDFRGIGFEFKKDNLGKEVKSFNENINGGRLSLWPNGLKTTLTKIDLLVIKPPM